jgi:hypothetical protein
MLTPNRASSIHAAAFQAAVMIHVVRAEHKSQVVRKANAFRWESVKFPDPGAP